MPGCRRGVVLPVFLGGGDKKSSEQAGCEIACSRQVMDACYQIDSFTQIQSFGAGIVNDNSTKHIGMNFACEHIQSGCVELHYAAAAIRFGLIERYVMFVFRVGTARPD